MVHKFPKFDEVYSSTLKRVRIWENQDKYINNRENLKKFGKLYEPAYFYGEFERIFLNALHYYFENLSSVKIKQNTSGHRGRELQHHDSDEYKKHVTDNIGIFARHGMTSLEMILNGVVTYVLTVYYQSGYDSPPEDLLTKSDNRIGFWFRVWEKDVDGDFEDLGGNTDSGFSSKDLKYNVAHHSISSLVQAIKKTIEDDDNDNDDSVNNPPTNSPTRSQKTPKRELVSVESLAYPQAKGSDLTCGDGDIDWKGKLVMMSPEKFLRLAAKLDDRFYSKESLDNLRKRMREQQPIDHLCLGVDMERKKVINHEGRHRAKAALELGIEEVPVFVFTGSCYKRTPKWTPEEHDEIDKAVFEPELPR